MVNGTTALPIVLERFDYQQWRALTERALAQGERRLAAAHEAIKRATADVARLEREMRILRRALALAGTVPPRRYTPASTPEALLAQEAAATADAVTPALPRRSTGREVTMSEAGAAVVSDFLGDRPLPAAPEITRGSRDGTGIGGKAAAFLLELARIRVQVKAEHRQGSNGHAAVDLALDGDEAITNDVIALSCKGWAKTTARDGLARLLQDGHLERTAPGVYRLTAAGLATAPAPADTLPLYEPERERPEAEASGVLTSS